jgi:hypothetical protein
VFWRVGVLAIRLVGPKKRFEAVRASFYLRDIGATHDIECSCVVQLRSLRRASIARVRNAGAKSSGSLAMGERADRPESTVGPLLAPASFELQF